MIGRMILVAAIPATVFAAAGSHVLAANQRATGAGSAAISACQVKQAAGRQGQRGVAGGFAALLVSGVTGNTITGTGRGRQTITVTVSSGTTYSEADAAGSLADVQAGMRIFACGTSSGTNAILATGVVIQLPHLGGVVTAVNAPSLTLTSFDGRPRTLTTDSTTTYDRAGQSATLADVTAGTAIQAMYKTAADGSLTAVRISIVLPHLAGKVSTVSGTTITLTGRDGATSTVTTTSSTTYTAPGGTATADQVKAGAYISAEGSLSADGKTLTALRITVLPANGFGRGGRGHGHFDGQGGGTADTGGSSPTAPLAPQSASGAASV